MKKTCVMISGTNCSGKTSLMKALQNRFGGVNGYADCITTVKDDRFCFAGKYSECCKHGGVDGLNNTYSLQSIVEKSLKKHDVVFCEGSYLHTFGMNVLNALFAAENQLHVFLYAPNKVLFKRRMWRLCKEKIEQKELSVFQGIVKKQMMCLKQHQKMLSIGVHSIPINTNEKTVEEICDIILKKVLL